MKIAQPKLGARLKRCRIDLGHSLTHAAFLSGISKGHMHKIEAGGDLQISTLNKVLDTYNLRLIVTNK